MLLDEQLDHRLRLDFGPAFAVTTVAFHGWQGTKNGRLLQLAEQEFDAFITMDKGIEFQQNRRIGRLILVILFARTNRYTDVKPLIPTVETALSHAKPGQLIHVPSVRAG